MLTESQVHNSFNLLFKNGDRSNETFEKAEALLEELRAESPLRFRLQCQLEELRKMCEAKS